MNIAPFVKTLTLLVMTGICNVAIATNAEDAGALPALQDKLPLPGSDLKLEEAVSKANTIFVGEIVRVGSQNLKTFGQATYHNVGVKVLEVLRGEPASNVSVLLGVALAPGGAAVKETLPYVGMRCIFISNKTNYKDLIVLKLLDTAPTSVEQVRSAVHAMPQ